jgi:hypothetical protein
MGLTQYFISKQVEIVKEKKFEKLMKLEIR